MKVFVAASSRDRFLARVVINSLRDRGAVVHDWTSHPGYEKPELIEPERISEENLSAVREADRLVWIFTGHGSTGAPLEVGFAHGLRKYVYVVPYVMPVRENVYPHYFPWLRDPMDVLIAVPGTEFCRWL